MRIIVSISISFIALFTGGLNAQIQDRNPGGMQTVDRIVGQVGDNIILYSDIEMQKMQAMSQDVPIDQFTDCRILEELLYQNLLVANAKLDSIEVADAQVNGEMENRLRQIEQQIGGRQELEEFYGKTYSEIKTEFFDVIKERLLAQEMERIITDDVRVTPRDVERFFDEIPTDSLPMVNEQVALQQIVVFPKVSQRDKNEAIDKLNRWRNDVVRGVKDFKVLATMNSDDPGSAKEGGLIEASRGMMVKPFEAAAFSLNIGEISEVVETQYGFHIIQLVDRKGDDYTVRHILKIPEVDRSAFSQAAALIDECSKRLRDGDITWNEAVLEYSEDEFTKQNQGNLTNPYTGELYWDVAGLSQIDQEMGSALTRMEIGELTEPMIYEDRQRRKEGVRIIRLRDRTQPHQANLTDDYTFIKRAAENRKKEEGIQKWVNEESKETYINIDEKFSHCDYLYNW